MTRLAASSIVLVLAVAAWAGPALAQEASPTASPQPYQSPPPPPCPPDQACPPPGEQACPPESTCAPPPQPACPPDAYDCQAGSCPPDAYCSPPPQPACPPDAYDCQAPPPCPPDAYDCQAHSCPPDAACAPPPQPACPPDAYDCGAPPPCPPEGGPCGASQPYQPPCASDGSYCPPPPRNDCRPEDPYCRPPPSNECGAKMQASHEEHRAMMQAFGERMRTFHEEFGAARAAYGQAPRAPDEWNRFSQEWAAKGDALASEFKAQYQTYVDSHGLAECQQYLPPPPMVGMHGPGPGASPPPHYATAPPSDNRFHQEHEQVRAIREECHAQVEAVWKPSAGDHQGAPPVAGSTAPPMEAAPADGPSEEQRQRIHEIMRECEKRIRAHFEGVYEQELRPDAAGQNDLRRLQGSFSLSFDEAAQEITVTGKYQSFTGNQNSQQMSDFTCGGQAFLDSLAAGGYLENFVFDQDTEGTTRLSVSSAGAVVLQVFDNARCTINVAPGGTIQAITIDLADYLDVESTASGYRFSDGETDGSLLVHTGECAQQDGNAFACTGKATFLVANSAGARASGNSLATDRNVQAALEQGHIGAEIIIDSADGETSTEATPYGDMVVSVEDTDGADQAGQITVTVDKEDGEASTVVMSLSDDALAVGQLADVTVEVFDVADAPTADADDAGTAKAVEAACTQEADNLQDVLDPTDDDCSEYWVVIDKHGTQVLVSNPHHSEKKIVISSNSAEKAAPGMGLAGFVAAFALGLVIVAVRARRQD